MNLLSELRQRFSSALQGLAPTEAITAVGALVHPAQDTRFGDYQANFAMKLAPRLGLKPQTLAQQVIERLDVADLCEAPSIAGPGFINLKLREDWLATQVTTLVTDPREGVEPVAQPQTVVIDYSSPNVAKPMHVGHLRSTVIGAALAKLLSFLGHKVITDNHVGDWGTQFGMIIYGYKHFRDEQHLADDLVGELARLYRLVNQLSDYHTVRAELPKLDRALSEQMSLLEQAAGSSTDDKAALKARKKQQEEVEQTRAAIKSGRDKLAKVEADPQLYASATQHPEIATLARQETAKLHAGDAENTALWHRFVPACLAAIQGVYDRLGITFDLVLGESFYNPHLAAVVQDLQTRGLARESQGALCVFIPGNEAPFMVRKTDGAFTYATTDLATIRYRRETLKADVILYVVDARQSEHFDLLFATSRLWEGEHLQLHHISFGTVLGPDKRPYKTRSGDTVGLESLLDEAVAEALKVVESNAHEGDYLSSLDDAGKLQIANVIGLGGIKYADLKHNRESDYVFSWDKMLAKTGDTATYMQYAYARICGIMRKAEVDRTALRAQGGAIVLAHPRERVLGLQLVRFSEVLHNAAFEFRPHLVTEHLFQTANSFSSFYDECSVKDAETPELRTSRLQLCDLTARVIARGLGLLGIATIEQM